MSFPPPNYIACFPLQAYFVDRDTGLPLSGGYINFFEDEARTIPKDVFIQQKQPDNSYLFVNIGPTGRLKFCRNYAISRHRYNHILVSFRCEYEGRVVIYTGIFLRWSFAIHSRSLAPNTSANFQ